MKGMIDDVVMTIGMTDGDGVDDVNDHGD